MVQVQRLKGRPRFEPEALAALNRFRPHIARAAMLAARWRLERLRTVTQALALLGLPAVVLDLNGKAVAANDLIQDLKALITWRAADEVGFVDQAATAKLGRVLGEARHMGGRPKGTFPVIARDGARAIAHILPITLSARDLFEGGFTLLVVTPVEGAELVEATIIQGLFDLTPAEAAVARAVGEGLATAQIAVRQGVSVETIRTHVAAVFAKTGIHRRSDLVALLGGLQRIRPPAR